MRTRCRTAPAPSSSLPKPALTPPRAPESLQNGPESEETNGMATFNSIGDHTDPGFGVYVHWPFCAAKCPYCDFNSHVRHQPVDQPRFVEAFLKEMAEARRLSGPRTVTSIFMGGGTPSLMDPA